MKKKNHKDYLYKYKNHKNDRNKNHLKFNINIQFMNWRVQNNLISN